MRLLYLTLDDLSRPGAWRTHVHGITGAIVRLGWQVRVMAPGHGALNLPEGVEGVHLPRSPSRPVRWMQAAFGDAGRLADELASFRPDALYTRGVNVLPGWGPVLGASCPLVVEINGYAEDEAAPWMRPRVRACHRRLLAHAAAVTAVSGKLRADVIRSRGLPADRVFVVANGADLARFSARDRSDCRRRLGWSMETRVALFVGSFYPHHGLEQAVEAAAAVHASHPDVEFVLAGDGADRPRIRSLVSRRGLDGVVRLPGAVPPEEVPCWLGAADICLLTLRSVRTPERGCSPIKLYEYMASERPVAVLADSREVVEEVRRAGAGTARLSTGRLDEDAREFAADIRGLLGSPEGARAMAASGRRAAERMFNWERAGRRVGSILDAALGRGAWPAPEEIWP